MCSKTRPAKLAFSILTALFLAGAALTGSAQTPAATSALDGTIAVVSGNALTITVADGSQKEVVLEKDTLILARKAATLDAIKQDDPLGVAARRESDGSLTANGINIFSPELWSRVRKGQFPMQSGDVMTNALVTRLAVRVQGRVLYMKYDEGTTAINVPEGTRINRMITERAADLKPGMHIVVRGTTNSDGSFTASTVSFDLPAQG